MSEAWEIKAAIREQIHEHQRGGNLLKAEVGNGHVDQARVAVTFTGTRSDDRRTEFYLEKNESGESSSMYTGTMRCELGDQNDHYYLCGDDDKDGKVYLLKSNAEHPKDEKFKFQIKIVSDGRRYCTIKSLSTGLFLASDNEGNASLKRFTEQPKDIETWFHLRPSRNLKKLETDTLAVGNFNYDSIHFTASYCQASEVTAC